MDKEEREGIEGMRPGSPPARAANEAALLPARRRPRLALRQRHGSVCRSRTSSRARSTQSLVMGGEERVEDLLAAVVGDAERELQRERAHPRVGGAEEGHQLRQLTAPVEEGHQLRQLAALRRATSCGSPLWPWSSPCRSWELPTTRSAGPLAGGGELPPRRLLRPPPRPQRQHQRPRARARHAAVGFGVADCRPHA